MSIRTWIGNQGTNDPNDATQAVNWVGGLIPSTGDTLQIGSGATFDVGSGNTITSMTFVAAGTDVLNFTNTDFVQSSLTLGSGTTLNLNQTGTLTAGFDNLPGGDGANTSQIFQSGSASTLTINASGVINNSAFLFLNSPNGVLTINVGAAGSVASDYYIPGPILDTGGLLTVQQTSGNSASGTRFSNAGYILVASADGVASAKFKARMDGTSGVIEVTGGAAGAAAIEIATNMGGGQVVEFGSQSTATIDATTVLGSYANVGAITTTVLQNSFERFNLFGPGATIDLAGVSVTGLTYSYGSDATWGNNVLTLSQGGTVLARLRMTNSGGYVDGTGTYLAGGASVFNSNFVLASDGAGGTRITVANAPVNVVNAGSTYAVGGTLAAFNGPISGGTLDWGNAANWTGGSAAGLPSAYQAVDISNSVAQLQAFQQYVLTVTSAAVAGGLSLDDHFATLRVTAGLTLQAAPGQGSGGGLVQTAGTLDVTTGGTLRASNILQTSGASLTIEAGGSVVLSGVAPFALGSGMQGLAVEQSATISGGTLKSAGEVALGTNGSASLIAQSSGGVGASVTATYTDVGGGQSNDPTQGSGGSASNLTISGAGTVWWDKGGDATTAYSGAMLVGGGATTVNALGTVSVGTGGNGMLTVDQGATLIDSAYAMLGVRSGAYGQVTVQNGAQWVVGDGSVALPGSIIVGVSNIFTGTPALLTVGQTGNGSLTVASGGTITLGSEPLAANEYNFVVGSGGTTLSATASGFATINGGLLDSHLGGVSIGQRSNGALMVTNGGTVLAGAGGGVSSGVIVGSRNYVLNGTTTASMGVLQIGGGTGTSLVQSSADFVDGRDGIGAVTLTSGGSLQVTGLLWEGGFTAGVGALTDTGSSFLVNGGTASFSAGGTIFAGSTLDLESGAVQFGAGSAVAGMIGIAAGTVVTVAPGTGAFGTKALITDNASGGTLSNAGVLQSVSAGATLEVQANIAGTGTEVASIGGYLKLDRAVAAGNTVALGGAAGAGTLELAAPGSFQGMVSNFWGTGNKLFVDGIGTSLPALVWTQVTASYGTLAISINGTLADTVKIAGNHPGGFTFSGAPSVNGLVITALDINPPAVQVAMSEGGSGLSLGVLNNGTNILQGSVGTISLASGVGTVVTLYDGASVVGTGTADAGGNVSINASTLGIGTHVLSATAAGMGTIAAATTLMVAGPTQSQFVIGAGNDRLVGGGNDSMVYVNTTGTVGIALGDGNDDVFAAGATATVALGNGNNIVLGGNGADVVNVGTGNNNIYLGNGNDSVTAGGGTNHVIVGDGTNSINLGNGKAEIEAGAGANTITVGNGNDYIQAGNGANVVNAGTGNSGIQLGNGNNRVTVTAGTDTIILGDGNNTASLGASMSFLRVGGGNNNIMATTGNEQIDLYGTGTNMLYLGDGNNLIYGGGSDNINVGGGNNTISMTDGYDTIFGGDGTNAVTLYSTVTASLVNLGNGNNTVITGVGGAVITLGNGNNYVEALGGNNTITVGTGNNVVKGDSGSDTFNVGAGFVHGSGPSDVFNLGSGGGAAYGGWGANSFNISSGQWAIEAASGSDRIALTGTSAFAYVQFFDLAKDMLVLSNAAFGLGVSGLTGSATQAVGSLLSSAVDGSFSGTSLLAYNASTGVLYDRLNTSSGGVAVAAFVNDPTNIASRLFVGA